MGLQGKFDAAALAASFEIPMDPVNVPVSGMQGSTDEASRT